jgi:hypothetical protein
MNTDILTGPLRAIIAAGFTYAVLKGWIPVGDYTAETTAVVTIGICVWSIITNTKSAKVASIAAAPETEVKDHGNVIVLKDSKLAAAAFDAQTPNTAGDLRAAA